MHAVLILSFLLLVHLCHQCHFSLFPFPIPLSQRKLWSCGVLWWCHTFSKRLGMRIKNASFISYEEIRVSLKKNKILLFLFLLRKSSIGKRDFSSASQLEIKKFNIFPTMLHFLLFLVFIKFPAVFQKFVGYFLNAPCIYLPK